MPFILHGASQIFPAFQNSKTSIIQQISRDNTFVVCFNYILLYVFVFMLVFVFINPLGSSLITVDSL